MTIANGINSDDFSREDLITSYRVKKYFNYTGYTGSVGNAVLNARCSYYLGGGGTLENSYGKNNVAVGFVALNRNAGGCGNIAFGTCALSLNTYGSNNTALGLAALGSNTVGCYNIAIGCQALNRNQTGFGNVALGPRSQYCNNYGGDNNVSIGTCALYRLQRTGNSLVGYGYGNNNISIGCRSLSGTTNGNGNIALGNVALCANVSGNNNIAIGNSALMRANSYGGYGGNIAIGAQAGCNITTGISNTIIGTLPADAGCACTVLIGAGNTERIRVDNSGLYINTELMIAPPVVTITGLNPGFGNSGQLNVQFTVQSNSTVTDVGVLKIGVSGSNLSGVTTATASTGSFDLRVISGVNQGTVVVMAYATNAAGTAYSAPQPATSAVLCLVRGTLVALSDGTSKPVEDITYDDLILAWDFDRGCYAEARPLWIKREEITDNYNLLTFSDGSTLRTVDQHRIFNKEAGAFTYPMTDGTPVGTTTYNQHGDEITLIKKERVYDTVAYYNVISDHHMNVFADSILTSCRFNNIYPIVHMQFVKDDRILRNRSEFANIPDRFYTGLRLSEQTFDLDMIEWYVDRLIHVEVNAVALAV